MLQTRIISGEQIIKQIDSLIAEGRSKEEILLHLEEFGCKIETHQGYMWTGVNYEDTTVYHPFL